MIDKMSCPQPCIFSRAIAAPFYCAAKIPRILSPLKIAWTNEIIRTLAPQKMPRFPLSVENLVPQICPVCAELRQRNMKILSYFIHDE